MQLHLANYIFLIFNLLFFTQLEFEKSFLQHKSTTPIPIIHKITAVCYKYTKLFLYNVLVILFGIPLAVLWALIHGLVAFLFTWTVSPAIRLTVFTTNIVMPVVTEPLRVLLTPLVDASARFFSQIRIKADIDGSILNGLRKEV